MKEKNAEQSFIQYDIKHQIHLGGIDFIIAENSGKRFPSSAKMDFEKHIRIDETQVKNESAFLIGELKYILCFPQYSNFNASNNYIEIMEELARRLQSTAERHYEKYSKYPIEILGVDACIPNSNKEDYKGKICVIRPSALYPEYRRIEEQLLYVTGGNGAKYESIGTGVFGTILYSGEEVKYDRASVMGIADISKLPEWARENYVELKKGNEIKPPQLKKQQFPITTDFIYKQCNKHKWFTCGSNTQYDKLFEMVRADEPLKDIAFYISSHSDNISKETVFEILEKELETRYTPRTPPTPPRPARKPGNGEKPKANKGAR